MLILLSVLSAFGAPKWDDLLAVPDWQPVTTKSVDPVGEIRVFSAFIDGVQCLRADARSDLSSELLVTLVADVEGEVQWNGAGLTAGEILGRGEGYIDYYQYLDTPGWTFAADRFWILRGHYLTEGDRSMFVWDRLGDNGGPYSAKFDTVLAQNPGALEPPVNVGGWVFDPVDGFVDMKYYICSDGGGTMAKGLQDAAARVNMPNVVKDVVREGIRRRDATK